ncbi:hypothetical protein [Inhella gelatinilytica]|uniref:Solute-binding protein family 3/N-terminal domain-containing protein n=1 Tax=Inhella gelatinilytica TaxID=2795030 RepID=A0A931IY98_9BURK|nr:hypothetical protein [Inhella gelatinilytica]MBH9552823.1 hypothetical protein [Inhella gelatinilytica]
MRVAALALLLSLASSARATEVVWAIVDSAPYHLSGLGGLGHTVDSLGHGITDHLIRGLATRMPGFKHRLVHLPRTRLWRDMAAGQPLCYADAFKTPQRLKWAHFTSVTPPLRQIVVTRQGTLPDAGEKSLADLLSQVQLHGVFETDRSYGVHLDRVIAAAGPHVKRQALPDSPQLLRMLEAGRMDYVVEYPPAVTYLYERLQPRPKLDFHLIAEDRQADAAYVACTRGAWGLKVIQAVDRAMRDWALQPEASQALLRWMPPETAQQERPGMERFYTERAARSDVE